MYIFILHINSSNPQGRGYAYFFSVVLYKLLNAFILQNKRDMT